MTVLYYIVRNIDNNICLDKLNTTLVSSVPEFSLNCEHDLPQLRHTAYVKMEEI